jgi:N-acetylmuramoyl-L-alanine amidase
MTRSRWTKTDHGLANVVFGRQSPRHRVRPSWITFLSRALIAALCLAAILRISGADMDILSGVVPSDTRSSADTDPAGRGTLRMVNAVHERLAPTPVAAGTAPGTCLAFDPLHGNRGQTIFVDPGHGGVDSGTYGYTSSGTMVYEKNLTLATGLDLLGDLRADGYRVVMSRIDDQLVTRSNPDDIASGELTLTGEHEDTAARITCANAAHADVLISLHFNAYSDPSVGGTETIYDTARPFSAANIRLAGLAQRDLLAQFHAAGWAVPDRGTADDSVVGTPSLTSEAASYGHLLELGPAAAGWLSQPSTMPGILVEPLFLSRPSEADVATSIKGQEAIARGLTQAIDAFLAPASPRTP